jgi:spermidine synthase
MGKLTDLLTGMKILEEIESPINGEIKVVKGLAFGTYIQVEGLTQSGGILKNVWKKPLKKLYGQNLQVETCLILGLGGGTVAGLVRDFWKDAEITGIELDPKMVEMGKKYLELDEWGVKTVIDDAYGFVNQKAQLKNQNYDLILIDTYVGREFPKKFEKEEFLLSVKKLMGENGRAIFNRLYYGEKRPEAVRFGNKLEKIFKRVDVVYPEANVMFVCSE